MSEKDLRQNTLKNSSSEEPVLKVENLKEIFEIKGKGKLHAVDGVSFSVYPKETVGLVGESGCGKSTVGNVITGLLPATSGHIYYGKHDIARISSKDMKKIRCEIQMIFQDPYSSLNPRNTVYTSMCEPFEINKGLLEKGEDLRKHITKLVGLVGLEPYVLDKYPHELDGGKRQLVGIARALAMNPKFIVCDEPVSALDVSVQATIINYLIKMQEEFGLSYLFISHDLSVVRHISHRVAVMYLGQIVEFAETDELFSNTLHPYSVALLSAVPKIDFEDKSKRIVLKGDVSSPINPKPGCRFAPRCFMAKKECFLEDQSLVEVNEGHYVACKYWNEVQESQEKGFVVEETR